MANKVFEDRLSVWVGESDTPANFTAKLVHRLPGIATLGVKDVLLPRTCQPADLQRVRDAGLFGHLWGAVDGLSATDYANRALLDLQRLGARGYDLNLEPPVSDLQLPGYVRQVVELIRSKRPGLRMRINLAPWKAFALPIDLLTSDGNLYCCEQNYEGNMDNLLSPLDVYRDMESWGVPRVKATVMYAAHCRVLGSAQRVRTLPDLSRLKRGAIYSDDLLADAGLL